MGDIEALWPEAMSFRTSQGLLKKAGPWETLVIYGEYEDNLEVPYQQSQKHSLFLLSTALSASEGSRECKHGSPLYFPYEL